MMEAASSQMLPNNIQHHLLRIKISKTLRLPTLQLQWWQHGARFALESSTKMPPHQPHDWIFLCSFQVTIPELLIKICAIYIGYKSLSIKNHQNLNTDNLCTWRVKFKFNQQPFLFLPILFYHSLLLQSKIFEH